MKETALLNSGRTTVMCTCSPDCRTRLVIGEMCLTQGLGYLIVLKSQLNLNGSDIVKLLRTSQEIIFTTEDIKQSTPPAVLVSIYFDEKVENNKYAGYYIFASNKNKSENFSDDQEFDFWLISAVDHADIQVAKRLEEVPTILENHVAYVKVGETKVYL